MSRRALGADESGRVEYSGAGDDVRVKMPCQFLARFVEAFINLGVRLQRHVGMLVELGIFLLLPFPDFRLYRREIVCIALLQECVFLSGSKRPAIFQGC